MYLRIKLEGNILPNLEDEGSSMKGGWFIVLDRKEQRGLSTSLSSWHWWPGGRIA